jgi:ABC-2 type transport system ATP-binding protein
MTDAVVAEDLRKLYPGAERASVDGMSFTVRENEVVGLLGPNGAGKTTLVKMICGASRPTSGSVRVFGLEPLTNPLVAKSNTAAMHQGAPVEMMCPAVDSLRIAARFRGIPWREIQPWVKELTAFLGIADNMRQLAFQLSGGQRQRLQLARALLAIPRLLILDEPSAALDVAGRRLIWELVTWLRDEHGVTVLWASHNIDELERNCDRVIVLDKGRLLRFATPKELVAEYGAVHLLVTVGDEASIGPVLSWAAQAECEADVSGADIRLHPREQNGRIQELMSALTDHCRDTKVPLARLSVETDSLEDVFMRLTHDEGRTSVES